MSKIAIVAALTAALLVGCGKRGAEQKPAPDAVPAKEASADTGKGAPGRPPHDPYPSTYRAYPSQATLIVGATILTGAGQKIENGAVLLIDGKIASVGPAGSVNAPEGVVRVDAAGKWVTPGIIDIHSHLGVYPSPSTKSTSDGNEAVSPNTAQVWAEHSVWPQDPGFTRALAGGVTSMQILPGSANLFGGRSVVLKNVPARTVQEMKFPGAPYGVKMACGENPKRVYEKSGPSTRMANVAGYRAGWIDAAEYAKKWDDYWKALEKHEASSSESGKNKKPGKDAPGKDAKPPEPPKRDLKLETLAGVLRGEIIMNMHCYRADEMAIILDLAREFNYKVGSFHHAVEAYKIADLLAKEGVCAAVWADWWGFKLEAFDGIRENAALIHAQNGGCTVIHSDSEVGIQRLNQEAAKAMADGVKMGLEIPPETAISWITSNPAKAMGIEKSAGTLEVGKMADVVVWNRNPFSVYAQAEKVFVDGALMYDRADPARSPRTDFEIGQIGNDFTGGAGQ